MDQHRRGHPETRSQREARRQRHDRRDTRRRHGSSHGNYYRHRSHRGHYGHYGYYSYPYYNHLSYYGTFGFWTPPWLHYGRERGYVGRHRGTIYVNDYDDGRVGALDLDVSPEKAQIFIDGNFVGVADDYDGFPTFLWLEDGTYDVAIYKPGFETIFRQYTIYPGVVIDVEDRMQEGEAIHPKDHVSKSTVNRDERIRRNREREVTARDRDESEGRDEAEYEERAPERRPKPSADRSSASEVGRLTLDVFPPDAAVYLDGIFLGTGDEVTGLTAGLVVEPGEHLLEIARPGFESREIELSLAERERVDLVVELDRN